MEGRSLAPWRRSRTFGDIYGGRCVGEKARTERGGPMRICGIRILLVALALGCASPPGAGLPQLKFAELDVNADGVIDAEEFKSFADAAFVQADADGDGTISQAEYERVAGQHRQPNRRHRSSSGIDGGSPGGSGLCGIAPCGANPSPR